MEVPTIPCEMYVLPMQCFYLVSICSPHCLGMLFFCIQMFTVGIAQVCFSSVSRCSLHCLGMLFFSIQMFTLPRYAFLLYPDVCCSCCRWYSFFCILMRTVLPMLLLPMFFFCPPMLTVLPIFFFCILMPTVLQTLYYIHKSQHTTCCNIVMYNNS